MSAGTRKLSMVVAAYNEESNLPVLHERTRALDWATLGLEPEWVYVDDHSRDGTSEVLRRIAEGDRRVKVLRFSRNFGSHRAFTAGLEHCSGDAAVILAADLQDPPETIPYLVERWRGGAKVVWAVRTAREGETLSTRMFSRVYWWLMRRFAEVEPPDGGADFLLMDRRVVEVVRSLPERNTSLLGLVQWAGFQQDRIHYVKRERHSGRSKWTLRKKLTLLVDSLVGFSRAPIQWVTAVGGMTLLLGLAMGILGCLGSWQTRPALLVIVVILVVGGLQMMLMGILGEYLWRAFDESRRRPRYVVEERINL